MEKRATSQVKQIAMQPAVGSAGSPYPKHYVTTFRSNDGKEFKVRPIVPEDEPLLVEFHRQLSQETVYRRYFSALKLESRVAHERLLKRCLIDYRHEMALVAEWLDGKGIRHIVAVARLIRTESGKSAEGAFVVADAYQHRGLGSYLLQRITEIAKLEGVRRLEAQVLADNHDMIDLFRRAGFHFGSPSGGTLTAWLDLQSAKGLPQP